MMINHYSKNKACTKALDKPSHTPKNYRELTHRYWVFSKSEKLHYTISRVSYRLLHVHAFSFSAARSLYRICFAKNCRTSPLISPTIKFLKLNPCSVVRLQNNQNKPQTGS